MSYGICHKKKVLQDKLIFILTDLPALFALVKVNLGPEP